MPDVSTSMSREQLDHADFVSAVSQLRSRLAQPEEALAFDGLTEAILRFGSCEHRMRRAERLRAFGLAEGEASVLVESALAHNERGLAALAAFRPFADAWSAKEFDDQTRSRWVAASEEIRAEWREQVSHADVGKDDAQELASIMDDCCDVIDEGGPGGLGQHLARSIERLEEARRSDDRGTHPASPFPVGKVIMAALLLGITLAIVLDLLATGAPWWNFFLVALFACLMMLLVAIGC